MAYPKMDTSLTSTGYNLTPIGKSRKGGGVKYLVIHYTATDASAKNNCIYFRTGDRQASADYFIDKDGSIWKFNPDCRYYYTWQCGDGNGAYGITNANSMGIEVVSSGAEFTQAQKESLRKLTMAIMEDYGIPASRVVRHYDASRKLCPRPYTGSATNDSKWKTLHPYITGTESGWKKVSDGKWKYLKPNGSYAANECVKIDGEWYAFGWDGYEKIGPSVQSKSPTTGKIKL